MNPFHAVQALSYMTNRHFNHTINHIDDEVFFNDGENDSNCHIYDTFYNDEGRDQLRLCATLIQPNSLIPDP